MLVTEILRQNAVLYGQEAALTSVESKGLVPFDDASYSERRREITWRVFDEYANRVANFYNGRGIGRGNKVGMIMMNRIEWLPVYFGIMRSGAMVVPLNFRYTTQEIVRSAEFADLDAMVLDQRCVQQVQKGLGSMRRIRSFIFVGRKTECPAFAEHYNDTFGISSTDDPGNTIATGDDAAIYFSSGTTGSPKAVVYTHHTLELACEQESRNHGQTHGDCFVLIPPLYHVGAKMHWMGNLLTGGRGVLMLGFSVPAFFEIVSREKVTIAFLLLPWAQDILCSLELGGMNLGDYFLDDLRMIHMGAQPIPPIVLKKMEAYFPKLDFDISYGLTESGGPGCINLGRENLQKAGSIGRPVEGWKAKIIDKDGKPAEFGEPGELLLRGGGMMSRYYKEERETALALKGGWLHTGDIATKDQDGFYYIVDRKKDVIISGGENIYPVQIEDFIRQQRLVKDVAVFGLPHCRLGEAAVAVVELLPGAACSEDELMDFCEALPKFKRPKRIFFRTIPRNATGKIDKVLLRKIYADTELQPPPLPVG
ncbi:long-chain fatty acid--CoA ligase [Caproiciproducens sp. NJN-50]|uniref:class I adenylate-forming enzyme family protein n=1 Tax=Caproiciproducens sp. NJN-50 TaxID=2507162 RepID=UPI000FFE1A1C|nr:class I adenylate-forming enzyme family protein [Caproiciproducens sp. NJN-50]QAT49098.1 long-chain fatty acid--CoA ligase [Caproiciproducens sp. NJN-50]